MVAQILIVSNFPCDLSQKEKRDVKRKLVTFFKTNFPQNQRIKIRHPNNKSYAFITLECDRSVMWDDMKLFCGGRRLMIDRALDKRDDIAPQFSYAQRNMLQMDDVAYFSVIGETSGTMVTKLMQLLTPASLSPTHLIDAFACCGGSTICFTGKFDFVDAYEIDNIRASLLSQNLDALFGPGHGVHVVAGDFLQAPSVENGIYFLDPPWGGPKYVLESSITDFTICENCSLSDLILKLVSHASMVVARLPNNFDMIPIIHAVVEKNPNTVPHPFKLDLGPYSKILLFCCGAHHSDYALDELIARLYRFNCQNANMFHPRFYDWEKKDWIRLDLWKGCRNLPASPYWSPKVEVADLCLVGHPHDTYPMMQEVASRHPNFVIQCFQIPSEMHDQNLVVSIRGCHIDLRVAVACGLRGMTTSDHFEGLDSSSFDTYWKLWQSTGFLSRSDITAAITSLSDTNETMHIPGTNEPRLECWMHEFLQWCHQWAECHQNSLSKKSYTVDVFPNQQLLFVEQVCSSISGCTLHVRGHEHSAIHARATVVVSPIQELVTLNENTFRPRLDLNAMHLKDRKYCHTMYAVVCFRDTSFMGVSNLSAVGIADPESRFQAVFPLLNVNPGVFLAVGEADSSTNGIRKLSNDALLRDVVDVVERIYGIEDLELENGWVRFESLACDSVSCDTTLLPPSLYLCGSEIGKCEIEKIIIK